MCTIDKGEGKGEEGIKKRDDKETTVRGEGEGEKEEEREEG